MPTLLEVDTKLEELRQEMASRYAFGSSCTDLRKEIRDLEKIRKNLLQNMNQTQLRNYQRQRQTGYGAKK